MMKAVLAAATLGAAATVAVPARADTTEQLVVACTELTQAAKRFQQAGKTMVEYPETYRAGLCWGYADSMFYVFDFKSPDGGPMLGICKPDGFFKTELIRLFLDYVARNPDALEHRPSLVFYWAAYEKHACPR